MKNEWLTGLVAIRYKYKGLECGFLIFCCLPVAPYCAFGPGNSICVTSDYIITTKKLLIIIHVHVIKNLYMKNLVYDKNVVLCLY